ncbi:MAG: hypothetical protein KME47_09445 [Nodosilinea sp. WJT8-NPBG4]|jgi:hypothetical protein|nr:hypothetical protein [Nodosilinea sp. WJT8-NPBG4]
MLAVWPGDLVRYKGKSFGGKPDIFEIVEYDPILKIALFKNTRSGLAAGWGPISDLILIKSGKKIDN